MIAAQTPGDKSPGDEEEGGEKRSQVSAPSPLSSPDVSPTDDKKPESESVKASEGGESESVKADAKITVDPNTGEQITAANDTTFESGTAPSSGIDIPDNEETHA